MAKVKKRGKNKDNNRRAKKKVSILSTEKVEYVDWKDASLLRRFMSERAKIRARRVTGNNSQQQKMIADAIKVAREMALVPYANRVTSQRSGRGDRDRDRDRGPRADGPAPRPSGPPPSGDEDVEATDDVVELEGVTLDGETATVGGAESSEEIEA